jgi:hypothetical protein
VGIDDRQLDRNLRATLPQRVDLDTLAKDRSLSGAKEVLDAREMALVNPK